MAGGRVGGDGPGQAAHRARVPAELADEPESRLQRRDTGEAATA